jgi:hypothetical protein
LAPLLVGVTLEKPAPARGPVNVLSAASATCATERMPVNTTTARHRRVDLPPGSVIGGVDTHKDVHVAAAVDELGRVLGSASFATTAAGYRQLSEWLSSFGPLAAVGVEATGCRAPGWPAI